MEHRRFRALMAVKPRREKGIIEVQTQRLDDLLQEIQFDRPIDAIKVDVEDAEIYVLL
jgi:FkbM family methyltransferase